MSTAQLCSRKMQKVEKHDKNWTSTIKRIINPETWSALCQKKIDGKISGPSMEWGMGKTLYKQDVLFYLHEEHRVVGIMFGKTVRVDKKKTFYIELICGTKCGDVFFAQAEKYALEHGCIQLALRAASTNKELMKKLMANYTAHGFVKKTNACIKTKQPSPKQAGLNKDVASDGFWMTKCIQPGLKEFQNYFKNLKQFTPSSKEMFERYFNFLMDNSHVIDDDVEQKFTDTNIRFCKVFPKHKLC